MQPPEAPTPAKQWTTARMLRLLPRLALIVAITWGWGWVLNKSATASDGRPQAAGFGRGMLHGALMPGAMPSLLFGKDVVIYASNNNGRLYKLGYTFGVNACGALFFGTFFWRVRKLNQWRKQNEPKP
ncbi:MAG: hypothetical protein ACXW3Z_07980 [Limisphaerales bacterium]